MKRRLVLFASVPLVGIFALVVATIVIFWNEPTEAGYLDADTAEEATQRGPAVGPLRVCSANPRYFTDGSGKAVYLTGSHTWNNLQNWSDSSHPKLDYAGYLRLLREKNHNFMRLWVWEQAAGAPWTTEKVRFDPLPYRRSGAGTALDGEPKFDLTQFNQEYFDQLHSRVSAACDQGIYVSVMLFQGWSVGKKPRVPGNPWSAHPFHRENNVNGIDGDLNGDDEGGETHTLQLAAITALQERYVRKVVDTLNDLDNVLWEISNESPCGSEEWHYHMIRFIKRYEADKPKQHPVGMTIAYPGTNADLFESQADWISPNKYSIDIYEADWISPNKDSIGIYDYMENPPAGDGRKIIIVDTDHLWGIGGDPAWVWKSFTRGLNPIFMDPVDGPKWESSRRAMGHTLAYANRMNLAAMTPHDNLASSRYCLANPREEYLIFLPFETHWLESARFIRRFKRPISNFRRIFKRTVTLDLSDASGDFRVEWFNPSGGGITEGTPVKGGRSHSFTAPFRGDAVLYLRKESNVAKGE